MKDIELTVFVTAEAMSDVQNGAQHFMGSAIPTEDHRLQIAIPLKNVFYIDEDRGWINIDLTRTRVGAKRGRPKKEIQLETLLDTEELVHDLMKAEILERKKPITEDDVRILGRRVTQEVFKLLKARHRI